jgi:ADP-ribose pyrophosphatase YjhB (NUDIX family)
LSADDRRYPVRPVLGVGALIFEDRDPAGRILLVQRGKEPLRGWWSLPGGAVETGERLKDAIRREVLEETNLIVEPVEVAEIFERLMQDETGRAEYHYVLIDYYCRIVAGEPCAGSDSAAVAWVRRSDLPMLPLTEGTLEVIERVFDRYAVK